MSTKIYNGFILNMDMASALRHLREKQKAFVKSPRFLDAMRKIQFCKIAEICMEAKVESMDTGKPMEELFDASFIAILPIESKLADEKDSGLGYHAFQRNPFAWSRKLLARSIILNENAILASEYDDDMAFNLKLSLFPYENQTIGILHNGEADMMGEDGKMSTVKDEFFKFTGMEDFSYWNNTEAPDGITEDEWEMRGQAWDDAIPSWIPSVDGYGYSVYSGTRDAKPILELDMAEELYEKRRESLVELYAGILFRRIKLRKIGKGRMLASEVSRVMRECSEKKAARDTEYVTKLNLLEAITPRTFKELLAELGAAVSEE